MNLTGCEEKPIARKFYSTLYSTVIVNSYTRGE